MKDNFFPSYKVGSAWVVTWTVETADCGVLRTNMQCTELSAFVEGWSMVHCVLNASFGTIIFGGNNECGTLLDSSDPVHFSTRKYWKGFLVSPWWCDCPHWKHNCKSFLVTTLLGTIFGHPDLQTSHHPTSFCGDYSKKESVRTPMKPGGTETRCWMECSQHWPTYSLQHHTKHTKLDGCLSSRRGFTFTEYAIKLLCRFPQMSCKTSSYFVLLYWWHL